MFTLDFDIDVLKNTALLSLLIIIGELLINLIIKIKNKWDIGIILIGVIIFIYGWIKLATHGENKVNVETTAVYYITLSIIIITGIIKYMEHNKQNNSTMYSTATHTNTIIWITLALCVIDLNSHNVFNAAIDTNSIALIISSIVCVAMAPPAADNRVIVVESLNTLPYILLMCLIYNSYSDAKKDAKEQKLQEPQVEKETQEQINNKYNEVILNTKLNVEKVNKISLLDNNAS